MVFKKRYNFQIKQNKDDLTQILKELSKNDLIYQHTLGSDSHYSLEFNWDEFVITRKAEFSTRASFEPDAFIRLVSLSGNLTQVNVTIKFSGVSLVFLIFIQLGIIAGSLFGTSSEWNWLSRIALMIGVSGIFHFILWLFFIPNSKHLEKVIDRLFE